MTVRRDITRELDQQVRPSLSVAHEHELLVGRLERRRNKTSAVDTISASIPTRPRLCGRIAPAGDLTDLDEGEIGAQMRCGGKRVSARRPRCADHFDCFFKGRRPIVDAWKQVRVDVDELCHH